MINQLKTMEYLQSSPLIPTLFTSIALLLVVLALWMKAANRSGSKKLPPGPKKLPVIGNLHNLARTNLLPHQLMAELAKKHGPIMHLQLGQVCTIVMSSPEMAREVMKTHDVHFASRPQPVGGDILFYDYTNMVFVPYGEYAKQLRKICMMELLNQKRVLSFRPIREGEASNLVKEISSMAGKVVDIRDAICANSYRVISRIIIGGKLQDGGRYIKLTQEIIEVLGGFTISDVFPSLRFLQTLTGVKSRFKRIRTEGDAILDRVINEHRQRRSDHPIKEEEEEDIVDVLLNIQEKGQLKFPLTTDNIKAFLQDLIIGGVETSSTIIEWAMAEMLKNPIVLNKATKEVRNVFSKQGKVDEAGLQQIEYLKLVIKETLRLHPSSPLLLPRESKEAIEIGGYTIPAKARVFINMWAIARNPEYWKNAASFWPERFVENENNVEFNGTHFEYAPFGSGRRMCPGLTMGLINVEIALANLLFNFDWVMPNGMRNEDLSLDEHHGIAVGPKEPLKAIPIPYNSAS